MLNEWVFWYCYACIGLVFGFWTGIYLCVEWGVGLLLGLRGNLFFGCIVTNRNLA